MINKLKGKTFHDLKIRFKSIYQSKIYMMRFGSFGKRSVISNPVLIRNPKTIYVGQNVTIRDGSRIEMICKYNDKYYNPKLTIGDGTVIELSLHISCCNEITIGDKVLIAKNVTIVDNDHGYYDITKSIMDNDLNCKGKVIIGNNSFISTNSVITSGVTIGEHCIIGANSVVTSDILDYSIAVGIPAKIIKRYNFSTNRWEKTNSNGEFIKD